MASPKWNGVRDALDYGPSCIQTDFNPKAPKAKAEKAHSYDCIRCQIPSISEDCLFLNVYAPPKPPPNHTNWPVIVWIHGGGYTGGRLAGLCLHQGQGQGQG